MNDDDVPWVALRRRAVACGIDDRAFWRMSPAALIAITAGMKKMSPQGGQGRAGNAAGAAPRVVGSLTDCP